MRTFVIHNEEETREFGLRLAESLGPDDVVALIGDLGTGKTTLTKYIAEGLGVKETITSPTFTIVCEYHSGRLPLYHFDVYRMGGYDDMFEAGLEEYFYSGGVSVVEWADMAEEILPENTKYIYIEHGAGEGERIYKCTF